MTHDQTDTLYAEPLGDVAGFRFDERVAGVFPDMIRRSVPGYSTILAQTGLLAARFGQPHSRCYDLGCSLGASTLAMRRQLRAEGMRIVAVDNSPAMVERARRLLEDDENPVPVELVCADLCDVDIRDASVVVMNFTLQFIPLAQRDGLMARIAAGLRPGGVLILSEKVAFDDPALHALLTDMHHAFKRANGYSELEVSQKRTALENVLVPETLNQHRQRLAQAGFRSADVWFQCFNFASLVAIR